MTLYTANILLEYQLSSRGLGTVQCHWLSNCCGTARVNKCNAQVGLRRSETLAPLSLRIVCQRAKTGKSLGCDVIVCIVRGDRQQHEHLIESQTIALAMSGLHPEHVTPAGGHHSPIIEIEVESCSTQSFIYHEKDWIREHAFC